MPGKTSKQAKTKKNGARGRPKIDIDKEQFESLYKLQCTNAEVAAFFRCSESTIDKLLTQNEWAELRQKGKAHGKVALRRALLNSALRGDSRVLVHLSKSEAYLGNIEVTRSEVTGKDGNPVNVNVYLPENGRKDRD